MSEQVLFKESMKTIPFGEVLQQERNKAFDDGVEFGMHSCTHALRKRVSNQRRELRRLNRQLNALNEGMKLGYSIKGVN